MLKVGRLVVTIPKPTILSIRPNLRVQNIDDGFFVDIDEPKINTAIREIEKRAQERALEAGILDKAKGNAQTIARQLLAPIVTTPLGAYGIRVEFLADVGVNPAKRTIAEPIPKSEAYLQPSAVP